jgi:phage-related protein
MRTTRVVYFREGDRALLQEWLDRLSVKPRDKCLARLELLERHGHALGRPYADYLTSDIYELRAQFGRMNYRMLYFFHGPGVVVVSHGFIKQQAVVPIGEIRAAMEHQRRYGVNPRAHGFTTEG